MHLPLPGRHLHTLSHTHCLSLVVPAQHGESVCNLYGKIGGDSPLSHRGEQVSHSLCIFFIIGFMYTYVYMLHQFSEALKDFMEEQRMHGFKVKSILTFAVHVPYFRSISRTEYKSHHDL